MTLGELTRDRVAQIAEELSLKLDGSPLAAATANRYFGTTDLDHRADLAGRNHVDLEDPRRV